MSVLLVNPPLSIPTGPYPSVCYLAGYLRTVGVKADILDASLEFLLKVFSRSGLRAVRQDIENAIAIGYAPSPAVRAYLTHAAWHERTVETAIACLQSFESGATERAAKASYFPPSPRAEEGAAKAAFYNLKSHESVLGGLTAAQRTRLMESGMPLRFAFGLLGQTDEARYRASMVLDDLATVIRDAIDSDFRLDAYAEKLADDAATFEPLRERLERVPNVLDKALDAVTDDAWASHRPRVVGLTVPFPGSLQGALRMARRFKQLDPGITIVLGGGWINTTLRRLSDPALFDYVDFVTLDDGERPLQCILETVAGVRSSDALLRTFVRRDGRVVFVSDPAVHDVPSAATGVPTYEGLPLRHYLTLRFALHQRFRLWARRWNKLTLAHGCYWRKCAFCDTKLDYIGRYEPAALETTMDRIRRMKAETGESGFHFVDEAMPPALLRRLAERLRDDEEEITWWGNVRFDEALAPLAPLLAASGCIALTGGLETASNRLLALMEKGVSLEQVIRVTHALSKAGIMVHAYLIYGFPTQTAQETIDALEYVRQLIQTNCLHSVKWHRFSLTEYSPVAKHPDRYGVRVIPRPANSFANYVLKYEEPGAIDHGQYRNGLRNAVEMFVRGAGFDRPLSSWFTRAVPETTVSPTFVSDVIAAQAAARVPAEKVAPAFVR